MAVPDFQGCMLPLLELAGDGQELTHRSAIEALAQHFQLTDEEREGLLPSGKEPTFDNRVGWARTYLKNAGLIVSTGRARFRITQRGRAVLGEKPPLINIRFLSRFPEFVQFRSRTTKQDEGAGQPQGKPSRSGTQVSADGESRQTPQEVLEASYLNLRRTLADDLLDRVKASTPHFFERLVVDLLVAMGYGGSRRDAAQAIGKSGDDGIDGIIKEDRLGLDVVLIQAKKWEGTVGRPTVQAFSGSLDGQRAKKGVFIATSQFSREARDYVERIEKRIVLIGGEELAQLLIDYNVGVAEEQVYVVKRVDAEYFGDE